MTPSEAKELIDAWLRARLDEDADLRDAPEGQVSAAVVFRRTEPWRPDMVVERWDDAQAAALLAESDGRADRLWGPGEYGVRQMTDRDIAVEAFRKPHQGAEGRHLLQNDEVARPLLKALLAEAGVAVGEHEPGFVAALRMMMKAQADLERAITDRRFASWRRWSDDDPAQPLVDRLSLAEVSRRTTAKGPAVVASTGTTLSAAESAFLAEVARTGLSDGRIKEFRVAYRVFRDWMGRDADLAEITPKLAGDYRIVLSNMPSSASTRPEYRELSPLERVSLARETGDTRLLSPVTIGGNYINPLRSLFDWARTTGKVEKNPFENIRPPKDNRGNVPAEREVFTTEQLTALFSQPLFVGAAASHGKPLYRTGSVRVDDWRFWVPLIGLFTGARLNEICGLALADFEEERGVSFFHIRPNQRRKQVKTSAAVRRVPIHAELVHQGVLARVTRLRLEGETSLFPELRAGPRGYLSDLPSKFFADLIDRALGKDTPVVFHSFRHTFITALRSARVEPLLRKAIVGHDPGETHEDYGEQDIAALDAEVQKVSYKGVNLAKLRRE